ncbi:MAG: hypothetical protein ACRC6T_03660 [Sarcina sp.]
MIKKKIILVISVLVVLGGAVATLGIYKNYSDNENRAYIQNSIERFNSDLAVNNLSAASTELKTLTARSKGLNDKGLDNTVSDLSTALIKKQNEAQIKADLKNLSDLIAKGSLSEAGFQAKKIASEDLSVADAKELKQQEADLKEAKASEKTATQEINAMNTLNNLMDDGSYEKANDYIANLDTSGFSDESLAKIASDSKQIQAYQNKFNINDYDIPQSQLTGLYKEAFPASKDTVSISSTLPVYFIGTIPVYEVSTSSSKTPIIYLSADGKNVSKTQFTTELNNKNLYSVVDNKKALATSIPSDAQ